ncbi:hypothetical protein DNK65_05735 [Citrobacter koseri]|nr:hypothetical protein DNK65_05735 [Citrobacter koseri]
MRTERKTAARRLPFFYPFCAAAEAVSVQRIPSNMAPFQLFLKQKIRCSCDNSQKGFLDKK